MWPGDESIHMARNRAREKLVADGQEYSYAANSQEIE
jgi:hypothetical protein